MRYPPPSSCAPVIVESGSMVTVQSCRADVIEDLQEDQREHPHHSSGGKGKEIQEPMDADKQLALALLVDEVALSYSFLNEDLQGSNYPRFFEDHPAAREAVDALNLLPTGWAEFLSSSGETGAVRALSSLVLADDHHPEEIADNVIANPDMPSDYQVQINNFGCAVCRENITGKGATLYCGHQYDIDCLKNMFSANVNDEYRFPPRCCGQVIPLSCIEDDLPQDTAELYRAKIAEYQTPTRLYCSNKQCAKFMGPRQQHAVAAKCSSCSTETCALCTSPAHAATVCCTVDKGLRKALKLGQSCGWQRCPRCRQLVERNNGCYHMSCRCGAQFCYLCAAEWKSCGCTGGTSRFLRLIGARKLRFRGNYLVKGELGSNGEGTLTRLCRKSWRGVVDIVTPASKVSV